MIDLKHTWNIKKEPNLEEALYVEGWTIIQSETERLLNKAWNQNTKGNQVLSDRNVQAANHLQYLFFYVYSMRSFLERTSLSDNRCASTKLKEVFDYTCIEKSLECKSIDMGVDLVSTWKALLDVFGITTDTEGCEDTECCLGISEMIIDEFDDCEAFIVGDCSEQTLPPVLGEFAPCEFPTEEIVFGDQSNKDCSEVVKDKNRCN